MEYKHNIVECDICELSDHLESMQEINGKMICGTCFDTYRKVRDIISAKQKNHKARKLSDDNVCEIIDYLLGISCKMSNIIIGMRYAEENGNNVKEAFKELYREYGSVKSDIDGLRYWLEGEDDEEYDDHNE